MNQTKNIPRLTNLCYYGFNKALLDSGLGGWAPKKNPDGSVSETFCNLFVNYVCTGFGYVALAGKTANEIVQFLSNPSNGWIEQDEATAQDRANNGILVIAGWSNPLGHGHVCMIVPGLLENSDTAQKQLPKAVNVGKDVFFGKKLSFAFQYPSEAPTLWALSSMI